MMPTQKATGEPRIKIRLDRLLLVEGKDEVNFFGELMAHCFNDDSQIQVIPAGGKDKFPLYIRVIADQAKTRPTLKTIGVVRDADEGARSAFQNVCDSLHKVRYEPPSKHGEFSDATPSIGVFIVPDGTEPGALETLCRRSVQGNDVANCVDKYIKCLNQSNAMLSENEDKSFAHAYLASMPDPMARVGEGARQGRWDFDSPAFEHISQFLRALVSNDA